MNNLDFSLQRRIEFITAYNITPTEFDVLLAIFMAQDHDSEDSGEYKTEFNAPIQTPHPEFLIGLAKVLGSNGIRESCLKLQEKGLIIKSCKLPLPGDNSVQLTPNDILFNKTMMKSYIKHSGDMFWELFHHYPSHIIVNNISQSARSLGGHGGFTSLDEAAFYYGKCIKFDPALHNKIIELVDKAQDLGLLNMGLLKFMQGQEWINLTDAITNSQIGNVNIEVNFA